MYIFIIHFSLSLQVFGNIRTASDVHNHTLSSSCPSSVTPARQRGGLRSPRRRSSRKGEHHCRGNQAKAIIVALTIEGELLKDESTASLFIKAIKECMTNAIRHGNAKRIDTVIDDGGLTITNNGALPESISYGNGLSGIKIEAEQLGCVISIVLSEVFTGKISK